MAKKKPADKSVKNLIAFAFRAGAAFARDRKEAETRTSTAAVAFAEEHAHLFCPWLPIEQAPKDGTSILIWGNGTTMQASWCDEFGGWRCGRQGAKGWDDTGGMEPTLYMPLPRHHPRDPRLFDDLKEQPEQE